MSLSVKFNDYDLSNILDVEIGLNTFEGADWERELRSIPNATGSTLISSKVGVKVINMPFRVKDGVSVKYDDLQRILNTKEVKRLTFGHMPNRYFMAVSSGTNDFKERVAGFIGHGTIKWIIPDGVSHSVDTKIVTASVVDGILTANVNNNGSDDIWPVYRFKYPKENGYQGIAHAGGVLELGNKKEADGDNYFDAETLIDTTAFNEASWSDWTGPYKPDQRYDNFDTSGLLSVSGSGAVKGLSLSNFGNNTKLYNGGVKVFTLPANSQGNIGSESVYCWFDSLFWAGKFGQTGFQDIVFWAGTEAIARWYITKTDKVGNSANAYAFVADGNGGMNMLTNYKLPFSSSHNAKENPFSADGGAMDILKDGDRFRFYCWGVSKEIRVPSLKNKIITKISIGLTNYDKRVGDKYMSFNSVKRMVVRTVKMDKWRDVANRYYAGSELIVDTESGNVYLNGQPANDEKIDGSQFKPLNPGQSKVEFYQSDWIQSPPEVTVEYKERYL